MYKFNMKLPFVNLFLNQNVNFLKTSESSDLFINSNMLHKHLGQGYEWKSVCKRKPRKWKQKVEMGDMQMKANWQFLDDEINIVNTVSTPSAKASRLNGPRSAPGTAIQKEEWDVKTYAHTHAHIAVCIYIYIYM
jgi:hypothetical protein